MSLYTLVQHSGYGYSGDPTFRRAVEERSVTKGQAKKVLVAGGILFGSYIEAAEAADKQNYPDDHGGLVPRAPGGFHRMKIDDLHLYIPSVG